MDKKMLQLINRVEDNRLRSFLIKHHDVLGVRCTHCIIYEHIYFPHLSYVDLHNMTDQEWLRIPNMGKMSLAALRSIVAGPDHGKVNLPGPRKSRDEAYIDAWNSLAD